MRFTEELINNPNESDVEAFWKIVAKLISLQKQLDHSYYSDKFPRDRLVNALNISRSK